MTNSFPYFKYECLKLEPRKPEKNGRCKSNGYGWERKEAVHSPVNSQHLPISLFLPHFPFFVLSLDQIHPLSPQFCPSCP